MDTLYKFNIIVLRPDWSWRSTSRGFALIGALIGANQYGMDMPKHWDTLQFQPQREFKVREKRFSTEKVIDYLVEPMLNGSTRYRFSPGFGTFQHEAGPFFVMRWGNPMPQMKGGAWSMQQERCQLVCSCGWKGKARAVTAVKLMITDQSKHQCQENFID